MNRTNNVLFRFGQFHLRLPLSGWANGYIYVCMVHETTDYNSSTIRWRNAWDNNNDTSGCTKYYYYLCSRHYQISTWEKGLCCEENCSGIWNLGVQTVEPYSSSVCTHLYTSIFFSPPPMFNRLKTDNPSIGVNRALGMQVSLVLDPKKTSKNKLK